MKPLNNSGQVLSEEVVWWDDGKDLWKKWVSSLEWNSDVTDDDAGEQVEDELESETSSREWKCKLSEWIGKLIPEMRWYLANFFLFN